MRAVSCIEYSKRRAAVLKFTALQKIVLGYFPYKPRRRKVIILLFVFVLLIPQLVVGRYRYDLVFVPFLCEYKTVKHIPAVNFQFNSIAFLYVDNFPAAVVCVDNRKRKLAGAAETLRFPCCAVLYDRRKPLAVVIYKNLKQALSPAPDI